MATVVSRRPGWYVLDAGSKAISKDFGMPIIKGQPTRASTSSRRSTPAWCDER